MRSRDSAASFPEIIDTSSVRICLVRYEGPLKGRTRPRSSTRSKIASTRSASRRTRPQSTAGLFVVNTLGRR